MTVCTVHRNKGALWRQLVIHFQTQRKQATAGLSNEAVYNEKRALAYRFVATLAQLFVANSEIEKNSSFRSSSEI